MKVRKLKNKKVKKAIWLYAVVLFTSAFILLVFTYFNQNEFDKSTSDFKNKIMEEERKRKSAQLDLDSLTKKINELEDEIDKHIKEKSKLEDSLKSSVAEANEQKDAHLSKVKAYEKLIEAENQYLKGNFIECATILLNSCDKKLYDTVASEKYDYLVSKSFLKASQQLYSKGLSDYKNKKYNDAINKFELSLSLDKTSYFSDDCYYYLAYSYINTGEDEKARNSMNELLINYPDSMFKNEALRIIKHLPG